MEMANYILLETKIPNQIWAEAVNTSVYLLNRLSTKALQDMTPYESWCGEQTIRTPSQNLWMYMLLSITRNKEE